MSKAKYVAGLRSVEQLISQRPKEILKVFVEYQTANPRLEAVTNAANAKGIEIQSANRARLRQMSDEARHQGVVAEIRRSQTLDEAALRSLAEAKLSSAAHLLVLVLDGIQDPHNLGACLRTADAAGVDAVVVPRHGAAGLNPTVSKVAAGAAENVPFAAVPNTGKTLDWLKSYGIRIIGTSDVGEKVLYDCDIAGPVALVMGREDAGLRGHIQKRCDEIIRLPMHGSVSSLNVSVATGICLYEIVRQRRQVIGVAETTKTGSEPNN